MKSQIHQPRPGRSRNSLALASVFAGFFTLFVPTANAGDLLGGIHTLFGHHYAGTYTRASDYTRVPRGNFAPAFVSANQMPTSTTFAPYYRYSAGGSSIYNASVVAKKTHGVKAIKHASYAKPAGHGTKYRRHMGKKYVRLKGVNRKTYRCIGHEGRPESYKCVEIKSRFIPKKGPWIAVGGHGYAH